MNRPETFLKALLLKEYEDRLKAISILSETTALDKQGRIVLEPDLKVRHKDSGFEYTIKKVADSDGKLSIVLRTPDSPRIKSVPSSKKVITGREEEMAEMPELSDSEFSIDKEDFEKNYEVD